MNAPDPSTTTTDGGRDDSVASRGAAVPASPTAPVPLVESAPPAEPASPAEQTADAEAMMVSDPDALPSRWSVRHVLLYSHDGRRRTLNLVPNAVNIITGKSGTGKSALAELIDYAMGSRFGRLPRRVREKSAWVGLVWVNGDTQCLVCRRVYHPPQRATDDFHYQVGANLALPEKAADLKRMLGRDQMLRRFEQLMGIGAVTTEVFGSTRQPVRVSLRNAMPFLLQDAAHIINNAALLRGSDDERRQHLIDTLPYYLGVVNEETVAREAVLKRLRVRIAAEEQRVAALQASAPDRGSAARRLLREGAQLGLTADLPTDADLDTVYDALRAVVDRAARGPAESFESTAQLDAWYDEERDLLAEGARLRAQSDAARRALAAATDFATISEVQRERLDVVDLLPATDDPTCPLCAHPLQEHAEAARAVRHAVQRVRRELGDVARERPKLDGVLIELDARRETTVARLNVVRAEIARAVAALEDRGLELHERRLLLLGRVAEHLESATPPRAERAAAEPSVLDELRAEEAELASGLDLEAKEEAMDLARARISGAASAIAHQLPMDEDYHGRPVDFNPRTLAVSVYAPSYREDMREIGSDENILTLHVAVLLGLHRLFAERRRPVPGMILFDQLSRPYYPPDPEGGARDEEVISEEQEGQPEISSLKRYFSLLFDEAARAPGLQIIILEHAYFSRDPRFVEATRERWIRGDALVPADWPSRQTTPVAAAPPKGPKAPKSSRGLTSGSPQLSLLPAPQSTDATESPSPAVEPEAVEPEAVEPEAVNPEAVNPEAVNPEAVNPEVEKPEAAKEASVDDGDLDEPDDSPYSD